MQVGNLVDADFELVVDAEKLQNEDEVHAKLGVLVDDGPEDGDAVWLHYLLREYLLDQLHLSARFVCFGWIDVVGLHHPLYAALHVSVS